MPRIEAAGPGAESERLARLGVQPQREEGLTIARLLSKDDQTIDWSQPALAIHRRVMGLYPGAVSSWQGKRLKLLATEPLVQRLADQLSPGTAPLLARWAPGEASPGSVLEVAGDLGLVVATGGCPVLLREAQLEGKRASSGQALLQQLGAQAGDRLGT
jgi:methionyl-tRNA formyltransferase